MQRVLFNAFEGVRAPAGVQVISMNCCNRCTRSALVNDAFMPYVPEYYHDYRLVHMEHLDKVIDGLRFIFVELPKFSLKTFLQRKEDARVVAALSHGNQ